MKNLDDDAPDYRRGPDSTSLRGRDAQRWHARQAAARRERKAMKELAETVPCPGPPRGCGVPAGEECVSRLRGRNPKPLIHLPAHPSRIALARYRSQLPMTEEPR